VIGGNLVWSIVRIFRSRMFSISKSTSSTGDYRGRERDQEIAGRTGGAQRIGGGIWRFPRRHHCLRQETRYRGIQRRACLISCKFVLEKGDLHIPVFDNFLRLECRKLFEYRAC
jgi:hypothetical protein